MSAWRPTRVAYAELGGAAVLLMAATILGIGGLRGWLRATSAQEAYDAYHRAHGSGSPRLEAVNVALDHAPDDVALHLLKAAIYAEKGGEDWSRSRELYEQLRRQDGEDAKGRPASSWGKLGLAWWKLESARRIGRADEGRAKERAKLLEEAKADLAPLAKDLRGRAEPRVFLAAATLAASDEPAADKEAEDALDAALRADEPPSLGAALEAALARAEIARRRADRDAEVTALGAACETLPAQGEPRERGGNLSVRLRWRLALAIGARATAPGLSREDRRTAVDAARLAVLPVEPIERNRKAALLALDDRRNDPALRYLRESIGAGEALMGSFEAAKRTFQEALRDAPQDLALHRQLGAVFASVFAAEAVESQRKVTAHLAVEQLAASPLGEAGQERPEARAAALEHWLATAALAREAGEMELAVRLLEKAERTSLAAGKLDARVPRALGITYDLWRRPKPAIEAYRKSITLAPGAPENAEVDARARTLEAGGGR